MCANFVPCYKIFIYNKVLLRVIQMLICFCFRFHDEEDLNTLRTGKIGKRMKHNILKISTGLLALTLTGGVCAKTLVYCSEGSPEQFNPQLYTSGTSVDASAAPIYNRLVDFKIGTTELVPSLAESWEVSADGKTYTFHLRKGVKFQSSKLFKPTRDFNAD